MSMYSGIAWELCTSVTSSSSGTPLRCDAAWVVATISAYSLWHAQRVLGTRNLRLVAHEGYSTGTRQWNKYYVLQAPVLICIELLKISYVQGLTRIFVCIKDGHENPQGLTRCRDQLLGARLTCRDFIHLYNEYRYL